jgi:TRAP-type C4-dicarboxylate transport system permease small subunit
VSESRPAPPLRGWSRLGRAAAVVEVGIAAAATVVMFALVFVQALQRYLPVEGWAWTGELARYCLVWLTFTVAGVLVTTDSHISLQILDGVRNATVRRSVRSFAALVVALCGVGFAAEAWALIVDQGQFRTPSLRMPLAVVYAFPLLGFVSTAIRGLVAAVRFAVRGAPPATHVAGAA